MPAPDDPINDTQGRRVVDRKFPCGVTIQWNVPVSGGGPPPTPTECPVHGTPSNCAQNIPANPAVIPVNPEPQTHGPDPHGTEDSSSHGT